MRTDGAVTLKYTADEIKVLSQLLIIGLVPALSAVSIEVLKFINKVKSAGTFWGDFAGRGGFRQITDLLTGNTIGPDAIRKLKETFTASGAVSDAELNELDEATVKKVKDLVEKQKAIERLNAMPDFPFPSGTLAEAKHRPELYTDALLHVGNFLGAGRSGLQQVAEEQTQLLRQVVTNTRQAADGWAELRRSGFTFTPANGTEFPN
jgi:hypothetical protein